jgi:hypothetical protein
MQVHNSTPLRKCINRGKICTKNKLLQIIKGEINLIVGISPNQTMEYLNHTTE